MKINDKVVQFQHDGIKIGEAFVSKEDIKSILQQVEDTEEQKFALNLNGVTHFAAIEKARVLVGNHQFLNVRGFEQYYQHGFFLSDTNEWVIVTDVDDAYVLVRREDVIDPEDIVKG